jgi:chitinase
MALKARYVRQRGLGGAMFWELSGDTPDGQLVSALAAGLN